MGETISRKRTRHAYYALVCRSSLPRCCSPDCLRHRPARRPCHAGEPPHLREGCRCRRAGCQRIRLPAWPAGLQPRRRIRPPQGHHRHPGHRGLPARVGGRGRRTLRHERGGRAHPDLHERHRTAGRHQERPGGPGHDRPYGHRGHLRQRHQRAYPVDHPGGHGGSGPLRHHGERRQLRRRVHLPEEAGRRGDRRGFQHHPGVRHGQAHGRRRGARQPRQED